MSIHNRSNFREAMERSRRFLGHSGGDDDRKNEQKSTLFDHISIREKKRSEQRFIERHDLPSDAPGPLDRLSILSGDETNYAETVHSRMEAMRSRILQSSPLELEVDPSELPPGTPRWVVGEDSPTDRDGVRPVWREVLDQQRHISPPEPLTEAELGSPQITEPMSPSVHYAGYWPPILSPRPNSNFSKWQRGPSNRVATQAANEVIDYPGKRLNPLLISGPSSSGKSHLLWAIGDSLAANIPDRDVRLITSETFPAEELPDGWDDLLMRASTLLIDDTDRIIRRPKGADLLANLVGWAIDIGAQVVLTSSRKLSSDSLPVGRLRQAILAGVHVELKQPSEETVLLFLRKNSLSRGVSLTDPQLKIIASRCRGEWSRAKAEFETVCLSIESGAELIGTAEIISLLSGNEPLMRDDEIETVLDSDSIGAKIVSDVLDTVLPEPADYRAEIISKGLDWNDDYEPPQISLPNSYDSAQKIAGDQLRGHLQEIEARSRAATSKPELFAGSNLEALTDNALGRLENVIHEHRFELRELTSEISEISDQIGSASESELVSFADRMLAIELHLDKLRDLTTGVRGLEVEDFNPSELLQPVSRKVLVPKKPQREMKAILRPLKRRVLLPISVE